MKDGYKARLRQVRDNDAAHEAAMQSIAKAAGKDLFVIRAMGGRRNGLVSRDAAMIAMIDAAAKNGVTYDGEGQ